MTDKFVEYAILRTIEKNGGQITVGHLVQNVHHTYGNVPVREAYWKMLVSGRIRRSSDGTISIGQAKRPGLRQRANDMGINPTGEDIDILTGKRVSLDE